MTWNWKTPSCWQRCLVALLIVAAATWFRVVFFHNLGRGLPYLLFFPAVTLAALYGGLPAGSLATALSAALSYFWVQQGNLSPVESLALGIFAGSGIIISLICEAMLLAQVREKHAIEAYKAANQELQREVAARKREEEKMRRMATVVKDSNDAITIQDFDGRITAWNRGAELMYGYSEAEALAANIDRLTALAKVAEQKDFIRRLIAGEAITSFETQRITKDGRVLDVWMTVTKLTDDTGEAVGLASTERDITARKREEEKMRRMATVVKDSNDAITIQDFDGRITAWNRGAELMYGYSEAEALAANIDRLTALAKVAEQKDFIRRLIAGEAITSFETQRVTKDGSVLDVWMTVTKLMDDTGKAVGLASTERDITARKRSLIDLERSNRELEQFASVASHDLQEPLRMISSYTQLLAKRYGSQLDDQAKKYVNYTVDGAVRMQALINDLLSYSRVGTRGRPLAATDSHAVLGEALRNLAVMIGESHTLITNDDLPTVRTDASQLVLVFQNLIANAIKFRRAELSRIHVSAQNRGHEWVFAVRDNGIGIAPQHAERVFVIFQRLHTRAEYPGTGIGLAVCKRIVERHSGKIWFESEPGHGTTFFFSLPK